MPSMALSGLPLPAPLTVMPPQVIAQDAKAVLPLYFQTLTEAVGPMNWWPARTPFEVIVGAILTQNTTWSNVERAIAQMRAARLLTPRAVERVSPARLARLIRSSG